MNRWKMWKVSLSLFLSFQNKIYFFWVIFDKGSELFEFCGWKFLGFFSSTNAKSINIKGQQINDSLQILCIARACENVRVLVVKWQHNATQFGKVTFCWRFVVDERHDATRNKRYHSHKKTFAFFLCSTTTKKFHWVHFSNHWICMYPTKGGLRLKNGWKKTSKFHSTHSTFFFIFHLVCARIFYALAYIIQISSSGGWEWEEMCFPLRRCYVECL